MIDEERISPETSATLHSVRRGAYERVHSYRTEAFGASDSDILKLLRNRPVVGSATWSRGTPGRVTQRVYAQEAHRRGLKWKEKK